VKKAINISFFFCVSRSFYCSKKLQEDRFIQIKLIINGLCEKNHIISDNKLVILFEKGKFLSFFYGGVVFFIQAIYQNDI
jgi:hypothetical protein